jgi:hypothetical protein
MYVYTAFGSAMNEITRPDSSRYAQPIISASTTDSNSDIISANVAHQAIYVTVSFINLKITPLELITIREE